MPAIFLLTPLLLVAIANAAADVIFRERPRDACLVADPVLGHRARPNCVSRYKMAETGWIENRYNDCGYRTDRSCGPKPAGAMRVAVVGSSLSSGFMVDYRQSFAARAADALSRDCGRPVEFQNLGGIGLQWNRLDARAAEAVGLRPDLLLMVMTPYDLTQPRDPAAPGTARPPPPPPPGRSLLQRLRAEVVDGTGVADLPAWKALQYERDLASDLFLRSYLRWPDGSGFLQASLSAEWRNRFDQFDRLLRQVADRLSRARVPMVIVYVPDRAQVLLLGRHAAFPESDPLQLNNRIAAASRRLGVGFIDATPALGRIADPNDDFFILNDHLTPNGHALLTQVLVPRLLEDARLPFARCSRGGAIAAN